MLPAHNSAVIAAPSEPATFTRRPRSGCSGSPPAVGRRSRRARLDRAGRCLPCRPYSVPHRALSTSWARPVILDVHDAVPEAFNVGHCAAVAELGDLSDDGQILPCGPHAALPILSRVARCAVPRCRDSC